MNRCFLILLFATIFSFSYGQNCLPSGITFLTQAEVDAFPSNYPSCTEIDGNVIIGNFCLNASTDIDNLDSLFQLNQIHGSLSIYNNPDLSDLTGLEGLTTIDINFRIYCCENLTSLNGLNNLVTVGGQIEIGSYVFGNEKLPNLNGLSSLINPSISIFSCPSFKNFIGLNPQSSLNSLRVIKCDSLENFNGLESVANINGNCIIGLCNSNFNFSGLGNLLTVGDNFTVSENDNHTMDGLTSLSDVQGRLEILECASLNDINGLNSLNSCRSLEISQCPSLQTLSGLSNFNYFHSPSSDINYISIFGNSSLHDISALSSIDTTGLDELEISFNSVLSECAIEMVCNFIDANPDFSYIENNMVGCNSVSEIETACSTLPVTYSKELKAHKLGQNILLNFSVSQQINNKEFELQHSMDGRIFQKIESLKGESYSSIILDYDFIHRSPQFGKNYYRIKQIDLDGNYSFSRIAQISFQNEQSSKVYPNPTSSRIFINDSKSKEILIYSVQGKLLCNTQIDQNGFDISDLEAGVYFYSVGNFNGKLVKTD